MVPGLLQKKLELIKVRPKLSWSYKIRYGTCLLTKSVAFCYYLRPTLARLIFLV